MRKEDSSGKTARPKIGLTHFYPREAMGLSPVDNEMIPGIAREISKRLRRRESNRKE